MNSRQDKEHFNTNNQSYPSAKRRTHKMLALIVVAVFTRVLVTRRTRCDNVTRNPERIGPRRYTCLRRTRRSSPIKLELSVQI